MRNFIVLLILTFSVCAQGAALPDQILIKSATQSFTHEYDVAIQDGKIRYKPRSVRDSSQWQLLGKTGLPAAASFMGLGGFASPASVEQLSADGDNLIALGNDGVIYYMKWSTRKWVNQWGQPFSNPLRLPDRIRAWSISHRGPFAGGYSDIDGNFHAISAGVTTLYALSEDGLKISYADPWLPADFDREICGPQGNRFRARSLSASASTLFVINDTGDMYTRLADFDTLGLNPFLPYSYERRIIDLEKERDVRTLPAEDWKKQPSISPSEGRITSAITIFQTGRGNDARELRVEGVNTQGTHGFFSKPIKAEAWQFTPTNLPLQKPLLSGDSRHSDPGPNLERTLSGSLRSVYLFEDSIYPVELKFFNPPCADATLVVMLGPDRIEFPVSMIASSRAARKIKGAMFLTQGLKTQALDNKVLQAFVRKVFGGHSFVEIKISIDKNGTALIQTH